MDEDEATLLGHYLSRGGEKLKVTKLPDRFTVRLRRGATTSKVAGRYNAAHHRSLARQDLEEFAVEPAAVESTMVSIRAGDDVEFASHVYALEGDPDSRVYLSDEVTVQFRPEVSDETIERLTGELGLEAVQPVIGAPRTFVFRVTSQATENPLKIANRLGARSEVLLAEPNVVVEEKKFHVPGEPLFRDQWHLHHTGGPFLDPASHIDAVRAWDLTRGERSVVVAVADDSVDLHHVEFQGSGKIVAPRDFAGRDFEPLPEAPDDNHGTACAGVAVAEENGLGVVGVAPGCALMPIRTTGFLDDTSIDELFDWVVTHGASVVSCSWGPAARYFPLSLRQRLAVHRAASVGRQGRGCVVFFAAGNSNRPVSGTVNEQGWPGGVPNGPTRWLDGFAAHEDVIAVAAATSLARKAAYSNWGAEIALCAPSNNAQPDTFPAVTAPLPGRGIVTADRVGPAGYSSTDYTHRFGGTSSACPAAAGVAALVLSANPDLTAAEVREILQATADKIVDQTPDPQLGLSLGNYDAKGHSPWFGYGKVNAFRAVTEAVRRRGGVTAQVFRRSSNPGRAIPDNTPAGIRDEIAFDDSVTIASIRVHVDITHTYIGDLRVTLVTPWGTSIVLHDRGGGNTHDLKKTYDAASTPALAALMGQSLRGPWTLQVRDLARIDTGRLDRWELEVEGAVGAVFEAEEAPGIGIPDNTADGIVRTLHLPGTGLVRDLEVTVDITHSYIGDLTVTLVSPANTPVPLHQREGGAADNLIATYRSQSVPALRVVRGQPVSGPWMLRVADLEAIDVGKLNRWGLRVFRE